MSTGFSSATTSRHYCHKCLRDVDVTPDLICTTCSTGFVEIMSHIPVEGNTTVNVGMGNLVTRHHAASCSNSQESTPGRAHVITNPIFAGHVATNYPGENLADNLPVGNHASGSSNAPGRTRSSRISEEAVDDGPYTRTRRRCAMDRANAEAAQSQSNNSQAVVSTSRNRNPSGPLPSYSGDILTSRSAFVPIVAPQSLALGQAIASLVNNMHDHPSGVHGSVNNSWGRDGVDAIMTQMLNLMEYSGPPPLPAHRIRAIPSVRICPKHIEDKMTCAICCEGFDIGQSVKKLPCSHIYHKICIGQWLALHATCPICRQQLGGNGDGNG